MMDNYKRTLELVNIAQDAEGASAIQFAKTLTSVSTKVDKIKSNFEALIGSLIQNESVKALLDLINKGMTKLVEISNRGAISFTALIVTIGIVVKNVLKVIIGAFSAAASKVDVLKTQMSAPTTSTHTIKVVKEGAVSSTTTTTSTTKNPTAEELAEAMKQQKKALSTSVQGAVASGLIAGIITGMASGDARLAITMGLTQGVIAAISSPVIIAAAKGGIVKVLATSAGAVVASIGSVVAAVVGIGLAVGVVAYALYQWTDPLVKAKKELRQIEKEIVVVNSSLQETQALFLAEQAKTADINTTIQEYKDLSNKISLTTEEQARLNEIIGILAKDYPQLVDSYDDAGNALLKQDIIWDSIIDKQKQLFLIAQQDYTNDSLKALILDYQKLQSEVTIAQETLIKMQYAQEKFAQYAPPGSDEWMSNALGIGTNQFLEGFLTGQVKWSGELTDKGKTTIEEATAVIEASAARYELAMITMQNGFKQTASVAIKSYETINNLKFTDITNKMGQQAISQEMIASTKDFLNIAKALDGIKLIGIQGILANQQSVGQLDFYKNASENTRQALAQFFGIVEATSVLNAKQALGNIDSAMRILSDGIAQNVLDTLAKLTRSQSSAIFKLLDQAYGLTAEQFRAMANDMVDGDQVVLDSLMSLYQEQVDAFNAYLIQIFGTDVSAEENVLGQKLGPTIIKNIANSLSDAKPKIAAYISKFDTSLQLLMSTNIDNLSSVAGTYDYYIQLIREQGFTLDEAVKATQAYAQELGFNYSAIDIQGADSMSAALQTILGGTQAVDDALTELSDTGLIIGSLDGLIKKYPELINILNEYDSKLIKTTADQNALAKELQRVRAYTTMKTAMENVNKELDKFKDYIEGTEQYKHSANTIAGYLGLDNINPSFVIDNIELIRKVGEGSEEAYNKLQIAIKKANMEALYVQVGIADATIKVKALQDSLDTTGTADFTEIINALIKIGTSALDAKTAVEKMFGVILNPAASTIPAKGVSMLQKSLEIPGFPLTQYIGTPAPEEEFGPIKLEDTDKTTKKPYEIKNLFYNQEAAITNLTAKLEELKYARENSDLEPEQYAANARQADQYYAALKQILTRYNQDIETEQQNLIKTLQSPIYASAYTLNAAGELQQNNAALLRLKNVDGGEPAREAEALAAKYDALVKQKADNLKALRALDPSLDRNPYRKEIEMLDEVEKKYKDLEKQGQDKTLSLTDKLVNIAATEEAYQEMLLIVQNWNQKLLAEEEKYITKLAAFGNVDLLNAEQRDAYEKLYTDLKALISLRETNDAKVKRDSYESTLKPYYNEIQQIEILDKELISLEKARATAKPLEMFENLEKTKKIAAERDKILKSVINNELAKQTLLEEQMLAYSTVISVVDGKVNINKESYEALGDIGKTAVDTIREAFEAAGEIIAENTIKLKDFNYELKVDPYYNQTEAINVAKKALQDLIDVRENGQLSAEQYEQNLIDTQAAYAALVKVQEQYIADKTKERSSYEQSIVDGEFLGALELVNGQLIVHRNIMDSIQDPNLKAYIDYVITQFTDLNNTINSTNDNMAATIKASQALFENQKELYIQSYLDSEQKIIDILIAQDEQELKLATEKYDALKKIDDDYLRSLRKSIEKRRQARDKENSYKDLSQQEKRLSLLKRDTSGVYAIEILNLEREIADARQDLADKETDDLLDKLEEENKSKSDSYDKELQLLNDGHDEKLKSMQAYNAEAQTIMQMDANARLEWLKENDKEYTTASAMAQEQYIKSWTETFSKIDGLKNVYAGQFDNLVATTGAGVGGTEEKAAPVFTGKQWESENIDTTDWEGYQDRAYKDAEEARRLLTDMNGPNWSQGVSDITSLGAEQALDWYKKYIESREQNFPDALPMSAEDKALFLRIVKAKYAWSNKRLEGYKKGGLVDYTGLANVHGSSSNPEAFLSAADTRNFTVLKDILSQIIPKTSSKIDSGNNNVNSGDVTIYVNVDSISSDYDVEKAINKVKKEMIEGSKYRNVNVVNKRR